MHCCYVLLFFIIIFTLFFSPIIFTERYLSPGDSFIQSIPSFNWGWDLWNDYIYSGFPQFADPQAMMWYPLRILLKPFSFNIFILSSYILAGCFTYGLLYTLTSNKFASLFSGIVFSMSGFFMAHLGHVNIIHSACWLPLILWSIEQIRRINTTLNFWFIVLSFGVANLILAGHPQIMFYSLALSSLYFAFHSFVNKKLNGKYLFICIFSFLIGIILACIQLIPTFELTKYSVRSQMNFDMFNEYSLPLKQVFILFFPYLFGGIRESIYGAPYFGEWNLTEITGYIGWLPIIFASVIVLSKEIIKNKQVIFWTIVAFLSLLLTFGKLTFLSEIMFHLPGFKLFRVPARHFLEYSMALSILSGLGIKYFLDSSVKKRIVLQGAFIVFFGLIALLIARKSSIISKAISNNVDIKMNISSNLAITIPVLLFLMSLLLFLLLKKYNNKLLKVILISFILIDLSTFGWFYEWRFDAPRQNLVTDGSSLNFSDARIVVPESTQLTEANLKPNLSQLNKFRSINGYNPLLLKDYKDLLSIETNGVIDKNNISEQAISLFSGKYIFSLNEINNKKSEKLVYYQQPLNLHLNYQNMSNADFKLNNIKAEQIGLVMRLSNSLSLKDGMEVAKVHVKYADGTYESKSITVGKDVSEWAIDRSDVKRIINQSKAAVYSDFVENDVNGQKFNGHNYVSSYELSTHKTITNINIAINNLPDVYLDIDYISLLNKTENLVTFVTKSNSFSGWVKAKEINGQVTLYENQISMPFIWSVNTLIQKPRDQIIESIKYNNQRNLNDRINFKDVALIEEDVNFNKKELSINSSINLKLNENDKKVFDSNHATASFVVLSNVFYPGWNAYIDGVQTDIYKVNYLMQGIYLPSGEHNVELRFEPASFSIGRICSIFGILILLVISFLVMKNHRMKGNNING